MPSSVADCYYIVTTATKDRSQYSSLEVAQTALDGLLKLQIARGYANTRNASGRFMSKQPDMPLVMFWIEDENGKVVS